MQKLSLSKLEIDDVDRKILQLLTEHPGISVKDIAEAVGRGVNNIYDRMKRPGFVRAQKELQATTDELLLRAQKIAARRLINLIKDSDSKIAIDAIKIALAPHTNKRQVDQKTEIVFKTRIGSQGQLLQEQEVIDVSHNSHKQDTSTNDLRPSKDLDEPQDNHSDNNDI